MREQYVSPVGFAKEPAEERRRWIGRIFLLALVVALAWLIWYGVITPPGGEEPGLTPQNEQPVLPGPE